jgi:hypothetical protein
MVRYVIDYYSLRKDVNGEPEFHLDVRPALDNFSSARVRLIAVIENILWRVIATCRYNSVHTPKLIWVGTHNLLYSFLFFSLFSLALAVFTNT